MSDQNQTLRDDISFLRALAEEGRRSPMIGGSILLASGLIFGTASAAIWTGVSTGMARDGLFHPLVWLGSGLLFALALYLLKSRMPRPSGAARAAGIAWSGSGFAICAIVFSAMILAGRTEAWIVMSILPSVILAIYGSCWWIAGALTRTGWFHLIAAGSWAMALVSGWVAADGLVVYLVYAAALYALMALPGYVLMRRAREQA